MTDREIYDLAASVAGVITTDLSEGIYRDLGGTLTMAWSDVPRFNASAESLGKVSEPPQHKITFHYELARQLYRDAELFLDFADKFQDDRLLPFFQELDFASELPRVFARETGAKNMFIGALTWVYFHERAHLWQEHGEIRRTFSRTEDAANVIEECSAQGGDPKGSTAALWHVTELAADFEATNTCLLELIRHFADNAAEGQLQEPKRFRAALYLLICGISCACYRFYGIRPAEPEAYPTGSHPTAIRRLEFTIPQVFELLDLTRVHGMDRRQLVKLSSGAAYSCGFYFLGWLDVQGIPDNYMVKGLQNEPCGSSYWAAIVETWDEVAPTVKRIRRAGSDFSLLHFTPDFRSKVVHAMAPPES